MQYNCLIHTYTVDIHERSNRQFHCLFWTLSNSSTLTSREACSSQLCNTSFCDLMMIHTVCSYSMHTHVFTAIGWRHLDAPRRVRHAGYNPCSYVAETCESRGTLAAELRPDSNTRPSGRRFLWGSSTADLIIHTAGRCLYSSCHSSRWRHRRLNAQTAVRVRTWVSPRE